MANKNAPTIEGISKAGPYSQVIETKGFYYLSGIIPFVIGENRLQMDSIQEATHQVLQNMRYILEQVGLQMDDVVKTTIYLADMNDYATVNELYMSYFQEPRPARAAVAVAALPKGAPIEMEAVAVGA
jgi:2-iminobutanoate/2-iminopropanoate deaminase